jgi:o-succinylbenzoate synthase
MEPIKIADATITPFTLPLVNPFKIGGNTMSERTGFYLDVTSDGLTARGEIAPLPGFSDEPLKKAKHDLEEILPLLKGFEVPLNKDELVSKIKNTAALNAMCPSVRFGVESALFTLAAKADEKPLAIFLGADVDQVQSAVLLQGSHEQIIVQAQLMKVAGFKVFKLKVGDRNIPLDVKKVQGLRGVIGSDGLIRLDGNRVWSFSEAVLFAQLVGNAQIEFIEEPLSDPSRLNEFYQNAHMPIALDETLKVLRCGVSAPGRCSPTLANADAVKAYVIKPMVLGGVVVALDWVEEARKTGKKAIISAAFESSVGLNMLKALACLTGQTSGLGTEQWLKQ